jgi:RimJ/RimL family protein N-acetyltransferase
VDSGTALQPPDAPLSDGVVSVSAVDARDRTALLAAAKVPDIARYFGAPPEPGGGLDFFRRRWADGVAAAFAIRIGDDSVGVVLLEPRPQGYADLGYWLLPAARGRGYASRAVRLVATWALRAMGFPRVQLWASPDNEPSQRVAALSGFKYEGRLRNFGLEPSGTRVDALFFSLVPDDLADADRGS